MKRSELAEPNRSAKTLDTCLVSFVKFLLYDWASTSLRQERTVSGARMGATNKLQLQRQSMQMHGF